MIELPKERLAVILSACFVLGIIIFELLVFGTGWTGVIIANHASSGDYYRIAVSLGLSLMSVAAVFGLIQCAIRSNTTVRAVYFILLSTLFIAEYAFARAFHTFSSFQFTEVAFFTANWRFIFDAARMYFNIFSLFPVAMLALLLAVTRKTSPATVRFHLFVPLLSILFFCASAYFTRNLYFTIAPAAGLRTVASFPVIWYLGGIDTAPENKFYRSPRERISYRSDKIPDNNIVFIIDESVRPDYLGVNGYGEPTSPALDELGRRGMLVNWGTAVAGATCSTDSNNLLLTGIHRLPDRDYDIYIAPTIFQYARAMGYQTYSIDAQVDGLWHGTPDDKNYIDHEITTHELNPSGTNAYDNDKYAAEKIREITSGSTGNFIWVNKYGVHKPYWRSYPPEAGVVLDDSNTIQFPADADFGLLRRSYSTAIKYNSEVFFGILFGASGTPSDTFYMYTSDHGQSLGENGAAVSHCSAEREAAMVPLMLIGERSKLPSVDVDFRAAHANIFASLLDLFGFPEAERKRPYAPSLLKTGVPNTVRRYYHGDIHGRGGMSRSIEFN